MIEDEKNLAALVAFSPEQAGYKCLMAYHGIKGLEMARRYFPNLILLDRMLPGMLGTEICKLLKNTDRAESIFQ